MPDKMSEPDPLLPFAERPPVAEALRPPAPLVAGLVSVVPPGETLNHMGTGAVVILLFVLARPLPPSPAARDWLVVCAPALLLALGWRDELVYHRRRSAHREDMLHTVAHLASGVMICTFLSTRLFPW